MTEQENKYQDDDSLLANKSSQNKPKITQEGDVYDTTTTTPMQPPPALNIDTNPLRDSIDGDIDTEDELSDLGGPMQLIRQVSVETFSIIVFLGIIGKVLAHRETQHQGQTHTTTRNNNNKIVRYCDLPGWYQYSLWITTGYRIDHSFGECITSILSPKKAKHNEFGNVWTEFIPAVILISSVIYNCLSNQTWILYLFSDINNCNLYTRYAIFYSINFIVILLRPFISGCAHCFHPISKKHYNNWWKADYVAIVWATMASASNFAVCEFFCNFSAYSTIVYLLVGISCILTVVICGSQANENQKIRENSMAIMLSFEFWGSFAYATGVILRAYKNNDDVWNDEQHFLYYMYWLLSVITSLIAAGFRMTGFPEKCIFITRLKNKAEENGDKWKECKKIIKKYVKDKNKLSQQEKVKLVDLSNYAHDIMEQNHSCDYWFTSHQWWHLSVNLSVAFQIYAWISYFNYRSSIQDQCC